MAVYSMTGYASATAPAISAQDPAPGTEPQSPREAAKGAGPVNVELRSVNGRFLDIGFRLPDELRSLEPALREMLGAAFRRGKIELRLTTRSEGDSAVALPQPEQLNRLSHLESTVQGWLPKAASLSVHEVLIWCKGSQSAETLDEPALQAAKRCIQALREARGREGARLAAVLMERTQHLRALAQQAEPLVPAVVQRQQQRFLERWKEALETGRCGPNDPAAKPAGTGDQRSRRLRHPHRRGRRAGAFGLASRGNRPPPGRRAARSASGWIS